MGGGRRGGAGPQRLWQAGRRRRRPHQRMAGLREGQDSGTRRRRVLPRRVRLDVARRLRLGGEWQSGKVFLGLVLPDDKAWAGGARWYRCDVTAFKDSNLDIVATTGSVKDGLRGSGPLGLTCLIVT